MNNLHPIMAQALQPFAPPKPDAVYRVAIRLPADTRVVYIQAPGSATALCRALELLLDDNDDLPANFRVSVLTVAQ